MCTGFEIASLVMTGAQVAEASIKHDAPHPLPALAPPTTPQDAQAPDMSALYKKNAEAAARNNTQYTGAGGVKDKLSLGYSNLLG